MTDNTSARLQLTMFTVLFTTAVTTVCSNHVLSFLVLNDNTQGLCYSPFNPMVTDLVVYERPKTPVDPNVIDSASILVFTVLVIIKMIFNWCKKKLQTPVLPAPAACDANLAVVAVEASAGPVAPLPMVVRQPDTSSDFELARQEQINADIVSGQGVSVFVDVEKRYEGYANIYENTPVFPHRQTGAQALASSPRSQAASANSEAASVASTEDAAPVAPTEVFASMASPEVAAAVETFSEIEEVAAPAASTKVVSPAAKKVTPPQPASTPLAQSTGTTAKVLKKGSVAALAASFEQPTSTGKSVKFVSSVKQKEVKMKKAKKHDVVHMFTKMTGQ